MEAAVTEGQLLVQNTISSFTQITQGDFVYLTNIAKVKKPGKPKDVAKIWRRSCSTLDFLGVWEEINNPCIKRIKFDTFKNQADTISFTLSRKHGCILTCGDNAISKAINIEVSATS